MEILLIILAWAYVKTWNKYYKTQKDLGHPANFKGYIKHMKKEYLEP